MPKRSDFPEKKPPQQHRPSGVWATQFVRGDLSPDQKDACKRWTAFDADGDGIIQALIDGGHKVTVKQDSSGHGYFCMVNGVGDTHPHGKLTLTGRGSTPLKAIKQAAYRHFVVFDTVWPDPQALEGDEDFDD